MCLGVPGRVISLSADGLAARVDFFGVEREVRLDVVDVPVAVGDYVLNHVGFAIRRIPEEEVEETLALYDQLLAELEREDLMAADVRDELAGTVGDELAGTVGDELAGTLGSELAAERGRR